jgi:RNA binding exosome subunit
MKLLQEASIRVLVHATESEEKVRKILLDLLPQGTKLQSTKLKGHFGNPILCLDTCLSEEAKISELWKKIYRGLSIEPGILSQRLLDRMGESSLYLRLDKQLAAEGKLSLTESGDAIHIRLRLGGPPSPEEKIKMLILEAEKEIHSGKI